MVVKAKPNLTDFQLPKAAVDFAEAADAPSVTPVISKPAVASKPDTAASEPHVELRHIQEGKIAAPLRLAPSVQQRIRRLVFQQSEREGRRVTAQDFMEQAIIDKLTKEEKKG